MDEWVSEGAKSKLDNRIAHKNLKWIGLFCCKFMLMNDPNVIRSQVGFESCRDQNIHVLYLTLIPSHGGELFSILFRLCVQLERRWINCNFYGTLPQFCEIVYIFPTGRHTCTTRGMETGRKEGRQEWSMKLFGLYRKSEILLIL